MQTRCPRAALLSLTPLHPLPAPACPPAATWCGPCLLLAQELEKVRGVAARC